MSEIFEFRSLYCFPYFTHAASAECAVVPVMGSVSERSAWEQSRTVHARDRRNAV